MLIRAKRGEKFLLIRAKRGENFLKYLFRAKRRENFFAYPREARRKFFTYSREARRISFLRALLFFIKTLYFSYKNFVFLGLDQYFPFEPPRAAWNYFFSSRGSKPHGRQELILEAVRGSSPRGRTETILPESWVAPRGARI